MNPCCIKSLMFTKNKSIKTKRKIDGKINLCSCCTYSRFKTFETIDQEKLNYLIESLI